MPLALLALALGAFGIGTTEFVISGLLPELASDLHTSIPSAGLLVSGYAFGVVIGAPLVTALGSRLPRKSLLVGLMVLFVVAHVLSALAPSYGMLMAGRIVASLAHGAYMGVGSVVAASLVRPEKRASAIAMMFVGLSLANVVGVPFGTFLGQALGWRATFWVVGAIGLVALAGLAVLIPRQPRPSTGLRAELAVFRERRVWLVLLMTTVAWAPVFAVVTYVAPMLTEVTGVSSGTVPVAMTLLGLGMLAGGPLGGRLADRALVPATYGLIAALIVVAAAMLVTVHAPVAMLISLTLFGMVASAAIPAFQTQVLDAAATAPTMASAANVAAFNLGNAIGPFLAGLAITAGHGYTSPLWVAALLGLAGLAAAVLSTRRTRHAAGRETRPATASALPIGCD